MIPDPHRLPYLAVMAGLLSCACPASAQLNCLQAALGEQSVLCLYNTEVAVDAFSMASSSSLRLNDCILHSPTPLGRLYANGYNGLDVAEATDLVIEGGVTDLLSDLRLDGRLSESGGRVESDNGSVIRKYVTLSPSSIVETGLGVSLRSSRSHSQELCLHFVTVNRQNERSVKRVIALQEPAAMTEAHLTLPSALLAGIEKPHLYYSVFALDTWKPADVSSCSSEEGLSTLSGGAMPQVTGLTVFGEPSLYFPAAFTPNGDGINDRFEIAGATGHAHSRLVVINSAGKVVFDKTPYRNDFGGDGLPAGTYYYIYYEAADGAPLRKSTLTIYR